MSGRVVGVAICAQRVESVPALQLSLTAGGIVGDRHAGPTLVAGARQKGVPPGTVLPNDRQVSLVSAEELASIADALGLTTLPFTWLAANVEVAGLERFTRLTPGARLRFSGGVVLKVSGENEPCRKVGAVIERRSGAAVASTFVKAARGLRGLVASVEVGGTLAAGETVSVDAGEE